MPDLKFPDDWDDGAEYAIGDTVYQKVGADWREVRKLASKPAPAPAPVKEAT